MPLHNRPLRQLSWLILLGGTTAGLTLLVWAGIWMAGGGPNLTIGAVLLGIGLVLIGIAVSGYAITSVLLKAEANISRIHTTALELHELADKLYPLIRTVSDNSMISDAARSITNRQAEQEALRQAIHEEMYSSNWEGAHYLANEMERRFGFSQEAQKLREELAQVRQMTIEEKIRDAVSHIEKLMDEHHWERARQESERLLKLFPRHEKVTALPAELNRRRQARKQELLAKWKLAVERNEIEQGIEILTELDQYLAKPEAQQLQESARGVFKARLLNLGVQFSLAVSEGRWRDALECGLLIRHEFPNSRMAQEVAEKLEILRVRAGFVSDAEIIQKK